MHSKYRLTKQGLIFLTLQLLILITAFSAWLIHRGTLFQKVITLDEYIVSENTVVIEDVTTDATMNEGGIFLSTPGLSLKKGTYTIRVDYNTNAEDNIVYAESAQLGPLEMHCVEATLDPACHTASLTLDLARDVTDLTVKASFSGKGWISITGTGIFETTDRYKRNIVRAFALCLLLNFGYLFRKSDQSCRKVILALTAIFGIT